MLGDGWHTVGFWLAHCWFMVGRMLHYGWRFMLGQRVSNEQSNVGPTKYVAVGPTLNQRLGFGWRMVIVLAGCLACRHIPLHSRSDASFGIRKNAKSSLLTLLLVQQTINK